MDMQDKITALESVVQTLQGRVRYLELHLGLEEESNLTWQSSGGIHDPESWATVRSYLNDREHSI